MAKLFATENDDIGADFGADTISPEEAQVTDVQVDTDADIGGTDGVDEVVANIEEGVSASDDLGEVQDLVTDAAEKGEGLTEVAAESIRLTLKSIARRVGANPQSMYSLYATENFASPSSRKPNTQFAAEGISEFLKDLWKKLKAALTKLWVKVKDFWNKHISNLGRVKKALEAAKAKVKASSGKLNGPSFLEKAPSSLSTAFAGKGDVSKKTVAEYLAAQGQIAMMSLGMNIILETIAADASDLDKLKTAMTQFTNSVKNNNDAGVLIVGGELLKIEADFDEDGKNFKMEVTKEPIEDKDEDRGMQIPDKADLVAMLEACIGGIKGTEAVRKGAEKSEQAGQTALSKIEKAITADGVSDEDKKALRISMNVLYRCNAQAAKIRGICASQNVRAAKAVLNFVSVSLKAYK